MSSKDNTKYWFEGDEYGKGRLVLAVVKKYLKDNPATTFEELSVKFPDRLQGSFGVFKEEKEAIRKQNSIKQKRYFLDSKDLLETGDNMKIAVCNQWRKKKKGSTKEDIDNFIEDVKKTLNYEITVAP